MTVPGGRPGRHKTVGCRPLHGSCPPAPERIVEAIEGPVRGEVPFLPGHEADALDRRLQEMCDREAEHVRKQLGKVKLSDLTGKGE